MSALGRIGGKSLLVFAWATACAGTLATETATNSTPPVPAQTTAPTWAFRVPKSAPVLYRGVAHFDNAGSGAGGMLYPAPSVVGLVAAVIVHALIVDSANTSEKNKIQENADKVLDPYRPILDSHTRHELMVTAIAQVKSAGDKVVVDAGERPSGAWIVDTSPTYSLVADQSAFVLHNAIAIYSPDGSTKPPYQADVTVVSLARQGDDHLAFWTANSGERLKQESAQLLAQSLDIAIKGATSPQDGTAATAVHKTFRYQEGSTLKMERGELLSAQCDRVVIKNLRGTVMSVPVPKASEIPQGEECAKALESK